MTNNTQPITTSHEYGQAELVEAIMELNNMGDDWDAQHIGEIVADWHNKKIEEVLDRLEAQWGETIDNTLGKPIRVKFVSVEAIQAERAKLKEVK